MKQRKDEHELFLNTVENAVRKCFERPTPDLKFEHLHGQRLLPDEGNRLFNRGLEPASEFRIDLSVVGLFPADIFTRRCEKLDRLQ